MRWGFRCFVLIGWLLAAGSVLGAVNPGQEGETAVAAEAEALLMSWMQQRPGGPEIQVGAGGEAGLGDWAELLALAEQPEGRERTKSLRALAKRSENPLIHAQVLRVLLLDTEQQGREALFIRRYGLFATGFNRVLYTGARVVQGNLAAVGQLIVDATYGLIRPKQATPLNRRLLVLEEELAAMKRMPLTSEAEIERLREAIDRERAESDMERAGWALEHGQPETALFFAKEAQRRRPEARRTRRLALEAESAIAAQRRQALGSGQVGYPDRKPPVELEEAARLRALLEDQRGAHGVMEVLGGESIVRDAERGLSREMRDLESWLGETERVPDVQRRWLGSVLDSAEHHPARQLAEARDRAQGQRLRFIFLGPERRDQQAYKAASWAVQSIEAVQTIGVFYVFEVIGRSMLVWLKDPTPDQDLRDALAWNLGEIEAPEGREQQWVRQWQNLKIKDGDFDSAREVIRRYGLDREKFARKIDRAEAKMLAEWALRMPEGPGREEVMSRLRELDAKRAVRLEKQIGKAGEGESVRLRIAGRTLLGVAGEQTETLSQQIEADGWYIVEIKEDRGGGLSLRAGDERGGERGMQPIGMEAGALKQWAQRQYDMQLSSRSVIERYARRRFPVEMQGGIGAGGVDLYPRLLPIQLRGEERLYFD